MRTVEKGSMTIFISMIMLFFLSFCLVLVEGVRNYYFQLEAAQAMELAAFSVLSEYQQELFENYGLFFLDLDYEKGKEQVAVLEKRANKYLKENATECETLGLVAEKFTRATDEEGNAFFVQAVEQMKVKSGYKLFEELIDFVDLDHTEVLDMGEILEKNEAEAQAILESAAEKKGELFVDISLPKISFPSIKALTEAVFGSEIGLSEKTVNLEERLMGRTLQKGVGRKTSIVFSDMQLFHAYLLQYCNFYGNKKTNICKDVLEYQVEYIISGHSNDRKNLENVMWKIFLLRTGGNYLFYHQDAEKLGTAEAEALVMVGVLGNPVLIKAVKEMILISQAIESSISETKTIFAGNKVPLYQNGILSDLEVGYEEYLYFLLNMTGKKEKIYRCMDIVELEVRKKSGYEELRLDHCVDSFALTWSYEFDSLFFAVPLFGQGKYENTITKKIFYEN